MARSWYERHVLLLVYVQQVGIVREEDGQGHVVHDVLSGLVAVGVRHAGRGIQHPFVQGRKTVVENMLVPLGLTMGSGQWAQGASHFLRGVSRTGLSSQTSPERLPRDAERGAVTDGVRGELEPEPATGLSFCGLQRLKASFVVAVVAAGGRQTFLALQLTSAVQFVAVQG